MLIIFITLYKWITKSFDKWEKAGIPHDKPTFPYGTHNIFNRSKNTADYNHEDYIKYKIEGKQKVHGWFITGKPTLSINDVEILKNMEVKDFNHFVDRNEANFGKSFDKGGKLDKVFSLIDDKMLA